MNAPNEDSNSREEVEKSQTEISVLFVQNVVIFLLLLIVFEILRQIKSIDEFVYTHRLHVPEVIQKGKVASRSASFYIPLGWILDVYRVTDEEFLDSAGLDAYVCLRFCKLCLKISCLITVVSCSILLPLFAPEDAEEDDLTSKDEEYNDRCVCTKTIQ